MKIRTALLAALVAAGASAHAAVIGFEDMSNPGCCSYPAAGYAGFNWSGGQGANSWVVAESGSTVFPGTEAHSGSNFAWSNGGTNLTLTSATAGGTFDFDSMWTRGGFGPSSYTVTGYRDGAVVDSTSVNVTTSYAFASFDFTGVDQIDIVGAGGNLLVDDITVNATSAVPESSNVALMLAGLGLLGVTARRRASSRR